MGFFLWAAFQCVGALQTPYEDPCKPSPLAKNFTLDELFLSVENEKLYFEDVICKLPPAVRSNYVLVNASQSAQTGTFEEPRVVFSDPGPESKPIEFAMSMGSGNSSFLGHSSFEIIRFDVSKPVSDQLEFREILCEPDQPCHLSKKNPELCLSCHSFNTPYPRPLWDSKSFFPFAYGRSPLGGSRPNSPPEARHLISFLEKAKDHPRYGKLLGLEEHGQFPCSPEEIAGDQCFASSQSLVERNNVLSGRLAQVNRRRVVELIRESPEYSKYKYATAGALYNCENIESFLPPEYRNRHQEYSGISKSLVGQLDQSKVDEAQAHINALFRCSSCHTSFNFVLLDAERNRVSPDVFPYLLDTIVGRDQWGSIDAFRVANLRWLFEGRGISMATWNMDLFFGMGFFRFQNGPGTDLLLDLTLLLRGLAAKDPDLLNLNLVVPSSDSVLSQEGLKENCAILKSLSLEGFKIHPSD